MKAFLIAAMSGAMLTALSSTASAWEILTSPAHDTACVVIAGGNGMAAIAVDENDYPVVKLAANLFADDVKRATGQRPVVGDKPAAAPHMVIAGTLGHSTLIDRLVAEGRLQKVGDIKGHWETTLTQTVEKPCSG